MNTKELTQLILFFASFALNTANSQELKIIGQVNIALPSSPIINVKTRLENEDNTLLSCKTDLTTFNKTALSKSDNSNSDVFLPKSMKYLNNIVKKTYKTMRNGVIGYVTQKIALSLLDFSVDSFSAKNIANYVSEGTKPYLPFKFANGVEIIDVTSSGGTLIYRTKMPLAKNHKQSLALALAGKVSATSTVCNDKDMVNDLLGRDIIIQYDYYDTNGEFFSSFTINS